MPTVFLLKKKKKRLILPHCRLKKIFYSNSNLFPHDSSFPSVFLEKWAAWGEEVVLNVSVRTILYHKALVFIPSMLTGTDSQLGCLSTRWERCPCNGQCSPRNRCKRWISASFLPVLMAEVCSAGTSCQRGGLWCRRQLGTKRQPLLQTYSGEPSRSFQAGGRDTLQKSLLVNTAAAQVL